MKYLNYFLKNSFLSFSSQGAYCYMLEWVASSLQYLGAHYLAQGYLGYAPNVSWHLALPEHFSCFVGTGPWTKTPLLLNPVSDRLFFFTVKLIWIWAHEFISEHWVWELSGFALISWHQRMAQEAEEPQQLYSDTGNVMRFYVWRFQTESYSLT